MHEQDYSAVAEDGRAILSAAAEEPTGFAVLAQRIWADDYRGAAVTFRADLRSTDVADRAGLVLRVTTEGQFINLVRQRLPGPDPSHDPANHLAGVTGSRDWTRYEVTAQIPPDAAIISFGAFLAGRGQIELRNTELLRRPANLG